jgi:ATP-binding protein involved in chromosome partitioning
MAFTISDTEIMAALSRVKDPVTGLDIVSSEMVTGLQTERGEVTFLLVIDPKHGAEMEPLRQAAESAVMGLPGIRKVTAILTAERSSANQNQNTVEHGPVIGGIGGGKRAPQQLREMPAVRHIIAVASGKGGVGKSTVSVNLALSLRRMGYSVGLMDADIYGPSIPRMLNLKEKPVVGDNKNLIPVSTYGIKVMSMGFMVDEAAPMIWRGPMIQSAVRQFLEDVDWSDNGAPLDVLVVDMPPGTGDAQLTLVQKVPLSGAVIVSTPQDIALIDARKGLAMFQRTDVPILGIVENMSYFCCPQCGSRSEIFGHGGARAEAEKLNVPFLGEIPLHPLIRSLSDAGTPVVVERPDSHEAKPYIEMAAKVAEVLKRKAVA